MALVVEDGTGLVDAESYASVAATSAYLTKMGMITAWDAATTEAQEVALRKATQYMDARYQWRGTRLLNTQALEHPRYNEDIVPFRDDAVWPPRGLVEACAELAYRALSGELLVDIADDQYITREKVGPLETVFSAPNNGQQQMFPIVTSLLRGLIRGTRFRTGSVVRSS